jgi:hypothetical protein
LGEEEAPVLGVIMAFVSGACLIAFGLGLRRTAPPPPDAPPMPNPKALGIGLEIVEIATALAYLVLGGDTLRDLTSFLGLGGWVVVLTFGLILGLSLLKSRRA